jgi:hypothetical protein
MAGEDREHRALVVGGEVEEAVPGEHAVEAPARDRACACRRLPFGSGKRSPAQRDQGGAESMPGDCEPGGDQVAGARECLRRSRCRARRAPSAGAANASRCGRSSGWGRRAAPRPTRGGALVQVDDPVVSHKPFRTFLALRRRRALPDFAAARERMVERHIAGRGLTDPLLLAAFARCRGSCSLRRATRARPMTMHRCRSRPSRPSRSLTSSR